MPNQHKNPMLGWRPPAELSAWARAEAKRRGVALKVILDEALAAYRRDHVDVASAKDLPGNPDRW
jgi:hypothetical protein